MGIDIVRRSDSGDLAGEVKSIAVPYSGSFTIQSVTAVITNSGNLRLINWHVGGSPNILRIADSGTQAGPVSAISIAKGVDVYVTAVRSGSGKLLLISWNVDSNGIQRLADSGDMAGEADLIRIIRPANSTPGNSELFVTACRSESGTLLLITWLVASDGTFQRLATAQAGAVSEISLAPFFSSFSVDGSLVATTVRASNGSALSIVWEVSEDGSTITRRGDSGNQMGLATKISSVVTGPGHLVVSCRASDGNLKLIALHKSFDGTTVTRVSDSGSQAGTVSRVSSLYRPYGLLTAVRAGDGTLLLIAWKINSQGVLTRDGDSADQAGAVDLITLDSTGASNAAVLTSVRTGSGRLKLITWDDGAGIS
jgi:hypothetical protein